MLRVDQQRKTKIPNTNKQIKDDKLYKTPFLSFIIFVSFNIFVGLKFQRSILKLSSVKYSIN